MFTKPAFSDDEKNIVRFNQILMTQSLDSMVELYLSPADFNIIASSKSTDDIPDNLKQLLHEHGINADQLKQYQFRARENDTEVTKSGFEQHHMNFIHDGKFISIFNLEICQYDPDSIIRDYDKTNIIHLSSPKKRSGLEFFQNKIDTLVIGCGQKPFISQNCEFDHKDELTIDAYASTNPDIVMNVERPATTPISAVPFKAIFLEAPIPLNEAFLQFLINNLKESKSYVDICNEAQLTKSDLFNIREYLKKQKKEEMTLDEIIDPKFKAYLKRIENNESITQLNSKK